MHTFAAKEYNYIGTYILFLLYVRPRWLHALNGWSVNFRIVLNLYGLVMDGWGHAHNVYYKMQQLTIILRIAHGSVRDVTPNTIDDAHWMQTPAAVYSCIYIYIYIPTLKAVEHSR